MQMLYSGDCDSLIANIFQTNATVEFDREDWDYFKPALLQALDQNKIEKTENVREYRVL